jgi:predicted RNase H-like HicB family nuclease
MKYRAVVKRTGDWWIGWLVDLPGVNAQERTREKLVQSPRIGAQEMLDLLLFPLEGRVPPRPQFVLDLEVPFEPEAQMTTVDVPDPKWAIESANQWVSER